MYQIVSLKYERSTKNALVYQEIDAQGQKKVYQDPTLLIGQLYVQQRNFGEGKRIPQVIQVSVGDEQA